LSYHLLVSLTLVAAVLIRQSNIWLAGLALVSAAVSRETADVNEVSRRHKGIEWTSVSRMLLACVPAMVVLAFFVHLWGGLTPPAFQDVQKADLVFVDSMWPHEGPKPAVPCVVLAIAGVWGSFYVLSIASIGGTRLAVRGLLAGCTIGFVAAVVVPSSWNQSAGRFSGVWNTSLLFPEWHGRSLSMVILAILGGGSIALIASRLRHRDSVLWLSAWVLFTAAQTANAMAWHRYYEPFVLIMFALAVVLLLRAESGIAVRKPLLWVLACVLGAITASKFV
jgi:hypothetical protein